MVFEISNRNEIGNLLGEESRWPAFQCRLQALTSDAVAHLGRIESEFSPLLLWSQLRRSEIQQAGGDAAIGEVRRDSRAHRAGTEHGCFPDIPVG